MRRIRKLNHFAATFAVSAAVFILTVSTAKAAITLQLIVSGFSSPVFVTNAGDGTKRLFIVERAGIIKVFQPVPNTTTVFLDISATVRSTGSEQGLLGLAFHPSYKTNGRFFVYYTRQTDGAIQIAEYQRSTDPNVADTTGKIIITIPHPTYDNHNGGTIAFGADGYLYAGTGDGGSGNDPFENAQDIDELLGKFIRLNIDVATSPTIPYTSPSDNPFFDPPGGIPVSGRDEIYAIGVRNPYRFSFDRGGTRQLWAGDVGQNAREEVDIITRGGNFGWDIMEGSICTPTINSNCTPPANYVAPVFDYVSAGNGGRCAVTGGYVYRGIRQTFTSGAYIYGDYCSGEILMWDGGAQTQLLDTERFISSFGEDEDGEIYVVGIGGTIEKLVSPTTTAATVSVGGRVTTAKGRGISNVTISLTDSSGNVRAAITGKSGYYLFTDVAAGETYIITASGKRYTFGQPSQILNIDGDMDNVNFVASR
jgi:glucose/arabinose dehydrogenase